jgi:hypothetical protein
MVLGLEAAKQCAHALDALSQVPKRIVPPHRLPPRVALAFTSGDVGAIGGGGSSILAARKRRPGHGQLPQRLRDPQILTRLAARNPAAVPEPASEIIAIDLPVLLPRKLEETSGRRAQAAVAQAAVAAQRRAPHPESLPLTQAIS